MADGLKIAEAFVALSTRGEDGVFGSIDAVKDRLLGLPAEFSAGEMIADKIKEFAAESVEAWEQNEQAVIRLNAVLAATGGAAGYTGDQMEGMAGELQKLTGFNATNIERAMGQMARFTNVRGSSFFDGMEAAADLAAQNMQDIESTAMAVGRALENPVAGMMMMSRMGVTLTEAERDRIKALAESGDILSAQTIILEKIRGTVGGVAQALRTPTQDLANAMSDVEQQVGGALGPAFDGIKETLASLVGLAEAFLAPWLKVGQIIGETLGKWLKDLAADIRVVSDVWNEVWSIKKERDKETPKPSNKPMTVGDDGEGTALADGRPSASAGAKKGATELLDDARKEDDQLFAEQDKKISDARRRLAENARTDFSTKYGADAGYDAAHGPVASVGVTPELFTQLDAFAQRFGVQAMRALLEGGEKADAMLAPYKKTYGSNATKALLAGKPAKPKDQEDAEQAVAKAEKDVKRAKLQAEGVREAAQLDAARKRADRKSNADSGASFEGFDAFAKSIQQGLAKKNEPEDDKGAVRDVAKNTKDTVKAAQDALDLAKQQLEAIKRINTGFVVIILLLVTGSP